MRANDRYTVYGPSTLARGSYVTTWTGRKLGRVESVGAVHPFSRKSYFGEKRYCRIHGIDNRIWFGAIGEGLASNIRRLKDGSR